MKTCEPNLGCVSYHKKLSLYGIVDGIDPLGYVHITWNKFPNKWIWHTKDGQFKNFVSSENPKRDEVLYFESELTDKEKLILELQYAS